MKTDNYLTLCLEQAAKSPLHYRHGCVIVKGGKVIGQGYNDYRSGFDGGALKHGRINNNDGLDTADLKEKLKKKKQQPQKSSKRVDDRLVPNSNKPFTPFENMGGGHAINTPLSMHSEMMAIHSALTASSTMASVTSSYEKPYFDLPCCDKRKARLRKEVLKSYVETVCQTTAGAGKLQVQECGFEASASQSGGTAQKEKQQRPPRPQRPAAGAAARQHEYGISGGSKWSETLSEPETEAGYKEREKRVSVRPVWTTDTTTWGTSTTTCVF